MRRLVETESTPKRCWSPSCWLASWELLARARWDWPWSDDVELELHELTLALHTLTAIQSTQCHFRHRALAQQQACVRKEQTPKAHEYGSRGCCWGLVSCSRQSVSVPMRTQRGHNRWSTQDNIFAALQLRQTTAPSSPVAVAVTDSSRAQLSPCPTQKPNPFDNWGGWRWPPGCRGVSVRRRGDTTLHCPHPFRPFCLALRSAVYFEDTSASRTPPHSLAYTTQWADRVTTYKRGSLHDTARTSPFLSHQSIIAEMYLILPAPMQRKVCHVSMREDQRPTAR